MSGVEELRRRVGEVERQMLETPELIEMLRPLRAAALERLLEAEAAEQEQQPSGEQLWREWNEEGVKLLRRSKLSAASIAVPT